MCVLLNSNIAPLSDRRTIAERGANASSMFCFLSEIGARNVRPDRPPLLHHGMTGQSMAEWRAF